MSEDTRQLIELDGRPGWRYDPRSGEEFYSAGWLDDGTIGTSPRHLQAVPSEEVDSER